jgi:hypothetical protein
MDNAVLAIALAVYLISQVAVLLAMRRVARDTAAAILLTAIREHTDCVLAARFAATDPGEILRAVRASIPTPARQVMERVYGAEYDSWLGRHIADLLGQFPANRTRS